MKTIFERVIRHGDYNLEDLLTRIDEYHISGKLTDSDREDLISMTRGNAKPQLDPQSEVQLLWNALKQLTARVDKLEGSDAGTTTPGIKDYAQPTGAHDAYFAGDVVCYNGVNYKCVAPTGVACVWSPDVMPTYWEQV